MNIDDIILIQPINLISGLFIVSSIIIFSLNLSTINSFHSQKYLNITLNYILSIIIFSTLLLIISLFVFHINILRNIIIFFLIINLLFYYKNFHLFQIKLSKLNIFILVIFFCLSLLPPLDADSLDYHLSGPIHLIEFEKFIKPKDFYWLHFRLVGSGEMMTFLGLILGSDVFGQIIQFSGIIIILINFYYLTSKLNVKFNYLIFILSLPVLLSLISSHKPFLFQSSLILTSIILCFDIYYKFSISKSLIIIIMLLFSIISKISFIVQAIPIFLCVFYLSIRNKNFKKILLFSLVFFILICSPTFLKNYIIWSEPLTPFFHLQDHENQKYIDSWLYALVTGEYLVLFPSNILSSLKNLIIPFKPAEYSQVLGIGLISFILLLKKKVIKSILRNDFQIFLVLNLLFVFISLILIGKGRPRFFLEIYYILGILLAMNYNKILKSYKYLNRVLSLQLLINLSAAVISIYLFLPASFHHNTYKTIMNKYSHQYEISNWINKNTKENTNFIYNNLRSRHAIKRNFTSYFAKDGDFESFMKENKIDYVVFNEDLKELYNYNSDCLNYVDKKTFNQSTKNFLRPSWKMKLEIYKNNCN